MTLSARANTFGEIVSLGGLEIDHKLELGRLLDRQICGLGPLGNGHTRRQPAASSAPLV
jgi:hypothetical protein